MAPRGTTANRSTRRGAKKKPGENRFDINADQQQQERRDAVITIGGQEFHRKMKDNEVSRQARELTRAQNIANRRAGVCREQADELDAAEVDEFERLEEEADSYDDDAIEITYDLVALLIEDSEGKAPSPELLRTKADIEDIADIARSVTGGGEPVSGPTRTPSSSG